MTNDLFRDLLEGHQPLPTRREQLRMEARALAIAKWSGSLVDAFGHFADAVAITAPQAQMLARALGYPEQPPADPRERALWVKRNRGTGPTPEPLRTRGRNNHYRTKG